MLKNYLPFIFLFLHLSLFAQIPTDGLKLYLPFNGNANDESGNGNNGTVNGATLTADRFGVENSAYSFNGVDNFISVPSTTSVAEFPNGQSISLWLKITSLPTNEKHNIIIDKRDDNNNYYQIYLVDQVDHAAYRYGESAAQSSQGNNIDFSLLPINQWFNLTFTTDLTTTKSYLNGVLINTFVSFSNIGVVTNPLLFGKGNRDFSAEVPFNGLLDDIRIYSRELDFTEIEEIYNEGTECKKIALFYLKDANGEHLEMEVSTSQWHYLAFTKAQDLTGKIYLDGMMVASGNFDDVNYSYSQLYLGVDFFTTWTSFYKGWIDEFRVSNVVREDSEILEHFQSNVPLEVDGNTIGLWHFDEISGSEFTNSASSVKGALYNGVVFEDGKFSNSVYFDGIDDRGDCKINIPESNITFEIWVKIEGEQEHVGRTIFQPYGMFNTNALIFDDCESRELGIEDEILDKSIKFYPNPVSNVLSIKSDIIPIDKVEIYSVLGQKVEEISSEFNSISTDNLSKGIYIIRIYSEKGITVRKLIKQ